MVRRMQLMEPEPGPRPNTARLFERLRDALLRDNKVIPPVLGALALIIFAWIVAGALIGGPPDGNRRQVANQADQPSDGIVQSPDDGAADPGVENRDAESFSQFDSKDPFGELPGVSSADEEGGSTTGNGGSTTGEDQYDGGSTTGEDQYGDGSGGDGGGEDFIDQTFPGGGDGGNGGGAGGGGGGGSGDLFDSGGNLGP